MVASANFVGNHGYNLVIRNNGLNGFFPGFVGLPSAKPDPRFQTVTQLMTGAVSNYRGMVLSLRRRMAQGLQFGFSTPSAMRWTKFPMPASTSSTGIPPRAF